MIYDDLRSVELIQFDKSDHMVTESFMMKVPKKSLYKRKWELNFNDLITVQLKVSNLISFIKSLKNDFSIIEKVQDQSGLIGCIFKVFWWNSTIEMPNTIKCSNDIESSIKLISMASS